MKRRTGPPVKDRKNTYVSADMAEKLHTVSRVHHQMMQLGYVIILSYLYTILLSTHDHYTGDVTEHL
jgi:hypothetical protein